MLKAGDQAPDFTLTSDTGQTVRLFDLLAEGPAVVFFYPADHTRVCTKEACMFRDVYEDLAKASIRVVGISPQPPESKAQFRAAHQLPYLLLADPDRAAARAYGVSGMFGLPLPFGVRRATFLISPQRTIVDAVAAELDVGAHRRFVERALAAAAPPVTPR